MNDEPCKIQFNVLGFVCLHQIPALAGLYEGHILSHRNQVYFQARGHARLSVRRDTSYRIWFKYTSRLQLIRDVQLRSGMFFLFDDHCPIFRRNATQCISPYAIVVCVCVSAYVCVPRFWTSGKRSEIETSFLFKIVRNNTGHNL